MSKELRCDEYPMLEVDEALRRVLQEVRPLPSQPLPLLDSLNRVISTDIHAKAPFPPFRCSIMDGYAVHAPLSPGEYIVQDRLLAGSSAVPELSPDKIIYITTGSRVPDGANAVIKVEDTEKVGLDQNGNTIVKIKVPVDEGVNVRAIGSDMESGELVIKKGDTIGPAEIGLLATLGISVVDCQSSPTIGVMSTGDELVNPWETPTGSQIRDSNRAALLTSFQSDGLTCKDLGIVRDTKDTLRQHIHDAVEQCDVVVTSGGVSMGDADFVKGLLAEMGTIHFGRLRMKPGKPTTFASIPKKSGSGLCYFFGLPGNPVSCLVTKALMVDPAVRRLQGMTSSECLHSQVTIRTTQEYKLDTGRPEYHRVSIIFNNSTQTFEAVSTGFQRSSRLMSMRSANGLMLLPKGQGVLPIGTIVPVILTGPLPTPPASQNIHPSAAGMDSFSEAAAIGAALKEDKTSAIEKHSGWHANGSPVIKKQTINVRLLTVSDRASQGVYEDKSGPEMKILLEKMSEDESWPLTVNIKQCDVVPDEKGDIQEKIISWTDGDQTDLILSSGGTGFGPRDITPESVRPLFDREAPAVAQALINEGLKHTPLAVLSRPVVGTRGSTLICTLPGSVKAIRENIIALKPLLPRIMNLISTGSCSH